MEEQYCEAIHVLHLVNCHLRFSVLQRDYCVLDFKFSLMDMFKKSCRRQNIVICFLPENQSAGAYNNLFPYFFLQAVLRAHDAVISNMRPGVSWVDMHK